MSAWHDLEDVLRHLVTAFMSTRFPPASASTLSDLLFNRFIKPNLEATIVAKTSEKAKDHQTGDNLINSFVPFGGRPLTSNWVILISSDRVGLKNPRYEPKLQIKF